MSFYHDQRKAFSYIRKTFIDRILRGTGANYDRIIIDVLEKFAVSELSIRKYLDRVMSVEDLEVNNDGMIRKKQKT